MEFTDEYEALKNEISRLSKELAALRDEAVKSRRTQQDLLANLTDENMPEVSSRITETQDSISLVVGGSGGGKAILALNIVDAINGESEAVISADRINLCGYVTVSSLAGGSTTIDGSCIVTGTLSTDCIKAGSNGYVTFAHPVAAENGIAVGDGVVYFGENADIRRGDSGIELRGSAPTYRDNSGSVHTLIHSGNAGAYCTAVFG